MMGRLFRRLPFVLAGSLIVAAALGKFRVLEVLGWAIFFGSLYWASFPGRGSRCHL
jgi:hypothetical protein